MILCFCKVGVLSVEEVRNFCGGEGHTIDVVIHRSISDHAKPYPVIQSISFQTQDSIFPVCEMSLF